MISIKIINNLFSQQKIESREDNSPIRRNFISNNNANIQWNDMENIQSQHREQISEDYHARESNIRQLHNQFFAEQLMHSQQK